MAGLLFASAPDWISTGQIVKYDMRQYATGAAPGNPATFLEFTVTEIRGDTITMELKQSDSTGVRTTHPADNTTLSSGQFWFDPALLATTRFAGQYIYEWQVEATGPKTVGGQEWGTVTLQKTVDGAVVRNTYDNQSGLLLLNTVVVDSQNYDARFLSINPAVVSGTAPPASGSEQPASGTAPPATPPASVPDEASDVNLTAPPDGTAVEIPAFQEPVPAPAATPAAGSKTSIPCVPGIFIFGLVGAGVLWARR